MGAPVRDQYEAYPYPGRRPAEEAKRLITGSPSRLAEIDHYLFRGRRDWSKPFRALFAGGGTGDGLVMLAQQLADLGAEQTELVYLDISQASRRIAEARIAARGLDKVTFHSASLLDLAALDLGTFDYIDCCGVLHHLPDPAAGLASLVDALAPDGGLGLMVYGEYGRGGVYPLQTALKQLAGDEPLAERVALARRLLAQLPATNWFRRNPFLGDHKLGDAELVDLLLHAQDRAYTVPELAALISEAGLSIASWIEPLRYRPELYLKDARLKQRAAALAPLERAALAERLAGNIKVHIAYLARRSDSLAEVEGRATIPLLIELEGPAVAKAVARERCLVSTMDGLQLRLPLPNLAPAILSRIDGRRSLGEIHDQLTEANPRLTWDGFLKAFAGLREVLGGLNRLLLRNPPEAG
jgi:SAM-dependent methyltransferase